MTKQKTSVVWQFVAVFVFAFLFRLLFLNSNIDRDWPFSIFYFGDSAHFHEYAVDLIQGKLYDKGIPFHPPFFAWLLSAIYRIHGIPTESGYAAKIWMAVFNAAAVGVAWLWFRRMMPRWAAWLGAIWLSVAFGWLVFSATFNNEAVYSLILTATAFLCWRNRTALSWKAAIGLGACMAVGALTRAEHLQLWPFLFIYLWLFRNPKIPLRAHLSRWIAAVGVSIVLIFPWMIRNWQRIDDYNKQTPGMEKIDRIAWITAYGPVNFALANNDQADGGFRPDLLTHIGAQGAINLDDPNQRHYFIHGFEEGRRWITEHPASAAKLCAQKVNRWMDGLRLGFGVSDFPMGLNGYRPPVDLFLPDSSILKWIFSLLLLAGIVLSFLPAHRQYLLCTLIVLHRLAITLLFFGYARGMVVLLPVLIPLMLLPVIVMIEPRLAHKSRLLQTGVTVAAVLLLIQAIGAASGPPPNFNASGPVDDRGKIIQDERIDIREK